ncbi:hypothetical protein MBAV_001731 [Candidatus Magnetobacterium bavaricum]|uniref:Uncharacterized protein n=1 Tax=Candidatus Magnetobacterium bavaricum TaxID=29290 RepID=A0A0F3GW40_9BACT|nr:hypothetical protein MBAV_001731 [Candidatus Magnetobacterium bavaricum]
MVASLKLSYPYETRRNHKNHAITTSTGLPISGSSAGKTIKRIPTPGEDAQTILNALGIKLPTKI